MTLKQLAQIRRWLRLHGCRHPLELQVWDLVLTAWVMALMATPVSMLIDELGLLPLCLTGFLLPSAYAALRRRLHRAGRLRCDWLTAL
ncbi:hypothetical protein [Pelomonas sp. KK5]|uniref:hypothetical protein n=1 Tax=Pelomonas sp. KK5 TaxID=1855730 RepID=UPI00097C43FB|nr:hypothetical protein [Pelomonas sp. KK5]